MDSYKSIKSHLALCLHASWVTNLWSDLTSSLNKQINTYIAGTNRHNVFFLYTKKDITYCIMFAKFTRRVPTWLTICQDSISQSLYYKVSPKSATHKFDFIGESGDFLHWRQRSSLYCLRLVVGCVSRLHPVLSLLFINFLLLTLYLLWLLWCTVC